MSYRHILMAAASAASLATFASQAHAQAKAAAGEVEELIVTGTRTEGRTRLESLAPVDVISAASLQKQGTTELATALATTVPSITFPRPSNTDGTDAVRPATLRGQGPDQTLVLVNGVRGHSSALLNLNGSVGRGSAAVDLNALPSTAIERIEVLRDGASALYGSDAIAGVINVMLRKAQEGGGASVTYGQYMTHFDGFYGRDKNLSDGATVTVAGWQGLKLGTDGFLTVSGEYRDRNNTNRSDIDPRITPLKVRSRFGDGDVQDGSIYLNAGTPIGDTWEANAWIGGQKRHAETAATYRTPTDATQNIIAVYPDGYIPLLNTHSKDAQGGLALKGEIAGWHASFAGNYGWNEISYDVKNTLNPSLGPNSPKEFYAGKLTYDQTVGNADSTVTSTSDSPVR